MAKYSTEGKKGNEANGELGIAERGIDHGHTAAIAWISPVHRLPGTGGDSGETPPISTQVHPSPPKHYDSAGSTVHGSTIQPA